MPQVLALAAGGASIVATNFGQLITACGFAALQVLDAAASLLTRSAALHCRLCTPLACCSVRCTAFPRFA